MSLNKIEQVLSRELEGLKERGALKGKETVIAAVKGAEGDKGPRYFVAGYGAKEFLRMNSNSYLGMAQRQEVMEAGERATKEFGAGPGAVRFISGTYKPHVELEHRLASFHSREAAMIFSSAYATVMGVVPPLISKDTIVMSDELNHNCIINAVRLSRPKDKKLYSHNNMNELESAIKECIGNAKRAMIITDGVFSMRGDHAPLPQIVALSEKYDPQFEEGIITIADDSHGVGVIGKTGRGTTEFTNTDGIDILVSTMGKALGINGGYLVSTAKVIDCLRETSPFYIYTNPITVSEASAALKALEILDSDQGRKILADLHKMTAYFRGRLVDLGFEVVQGEHPIVPLMIRDTGKTTELVKYLKDNGILSTGIYYPIVPKRDEEIRFQICAEHTRYDIDYVLAVLTEYKERHW
jgi:glycine C-acetyltransferase